MAISFLNNKVVSELCLGKPAINSAITTVTSVKSLLTALKSGGYSISHVSVWSCEAGDLSLPPSCVGKISMADIICYLCQKENFGNPLEALEAPVSILLPPKFDGIVKHLEENSSLLQAIDCIVDGSQNLVIPIHDYTTSKSMREFLKNAGLSLLPIYDNKEYCWLTQEDIARFLLNSIGVFSPIPTFSIESLNIIDREVMSINYDDPASLALNSISRAITEQTCVAVVDSERRLIGEISPYTLASCDETVAAAIMTLSAGDLMAYIDCGGPSEGLIQLVKTRLEEKGMVAMLKVVEELSPSSVSLSSSSSSSCSSDDESGSTSSRNSFCYNYSRSFSGRRSEAIMCFPWSSLVAVLVQALAHRVSYIWVVEDDQTLVGIVTFQEIFKVFRNIAGEQNTQEMENSFKQ